MPDIPKLNDSVSSLNGVGESIAAKLANLSISTISSLCFYLPSRIEDLSRFTPISALRPNEETVIQGEVLRVSSRRSQKGALIIQAQLFDESGSISVLWFNQRFLLQQLRPGQKLFIVGAKKIAPKLGNPFFAKKIITELGFVPIYPTTAGLTQGKIRALIRQCSPACQQIASLLPTIYSKKLGFPELGSQLARSHFQPRGEELAELKRRLGFEELFLLALRIRAAKKTKPLSKTKSYQVNETLLQKLISALPFGLTASQKKTAWEIMSGFNPAVPATRLLYGEVGSGKTAVALLVTVFMWSNGQRIAWLNPTVSLAHQQAEVLKKYLSPLGIKIALVTSDQKVDTTEADVIIGTQAILHRHQQIKNLGLVIADEQHRFGVEQRQLLLEKNPDSHLLMMTATPIPRSLAQTVFGHLAITYLTEQPKHQKPTQTVIFNEDGRQNIETEIKKRLARGESGYVICPLIKSKEEVVTSLLAIERKAVGSELKRLEKEFPGTTIIALHGKMSADAKAAALEKFKATTPSVLLSTTVVEVGIDNQQASWMLIEEADRFGLAQLHQLRGRIGRGEIASVCFMSNSQTSEIGQERLRTIAKTTIGLELAEADLRLRGPGEIIGLEQSGLPALRYADWSNIDQVKKAFAMAQEIIDGGLEKYPKLKKITEDYDQLATA